MIGTKLGVYEVTSKLGEGGMGEVYRATDTRLRREVAIKVLPTAFTSDPERLARFEREAQLLAQLHHPNIASIFGIEESGGIRALVMELVEGPTLAELLEKGSLPLDESLSIARQIAEALEEAHEKGIIHRDLKPQNVKASREGKIKVLDFGLAKAMDPTGGATGSASQLAQSPTLTLGATVQGVILGTAAYMAPEQAAGGSADRRADVWAFGVVLYEMLVGRRLFEGETVSHVLAGVLKDEPDFALLPDDVPPRILRLLRRCLRKKPRERLQAIGDARIMIDEVLAGASDEAPAGVAPEVVRVKRPAWQVALALAAAVASGALAVVALGGTRAARSATPRTLSEISLPAAQRLASGAPVLSPDGTKLAAVLFDVESSKRTLWIRNLASGEWRAVQGSENARLPFWSPDGRSLGFAASGQIRRVDLDGGRPVPLATAPLTCGAAWGAEFIVFCSDLGAPLQRVPPSGGAPEPTTEKPGEVTIFVTPSFLPDGRRFLFRAANRQNAGGGGKLVLGSTDGAASRELLPSESRGWLDGGQLFYMRGATLLARPFDAAAGKLAGGDPRILAEGVDDAFSGMFSAASGLLVYAPSRAELGARISIYDRTGKRIDEIDSDTYLDDLVLSPDGRRAAVMKTSTGADNDRTVDVWSVDLARKVLSRATYGENDDDPVFSPDGKEIAFAHKGSLYRRPVDGAGEPQLLVESESDIVTQDWTRDGWILYTDLTEGEEDLFAVRAEGGDPKHLTTTPFSEGRAQVSPDGKWLAFASDEGGDWQVYVTTWPEISGKWRVSTESGSAPQWILGGRELLYLSAGSKVMRVAIDGQATPPEIGLAEEMFGVDPSVNYAVRKARWAPTPDGERFYVLETIRNESSDGSALVLVTNPLAAAPGAR